MLQTQIPPTGSTSSSLAPKKIEIYVEGVGVVQLKGVKTMVAKGRRYWWHRASKTRLEGIEERDGRYHAPPELIAQLDAFPIPSGHDLHNSSLPLPGTLGWLFAEWRKSNDFQTKAKRTREDYERAIAYLAPTKPAPGQKVRWRNLPLRLLTPPLVFKRQEKILNERTWHWANDVITTLSKACKWGVPRGYLLANPCVAVTKLPRPDDLPQKNVIWTPEERKAVLADFAENAPQLWGPLVVGIFIGLREGDVLKLPPSCWDGVHFKWKASKNAEERVIVAPEAMKQALDFALAERARHKQRWEEKGLATPLPDRMFLNSRGDAWTESGFRASFFGRLAVLREKGLIGDGKTFHSHRHKVGATLTELELSDQVIKDTLANRTAQATAVYTRQRNANKLANIGAQAMAVHLAAEFEGAG